ncbi:MAG TPA: trehalose-phosphatase [Dyella sp.]|uniref:trehalose-phosphatase n=1 Tax=Dyella sp. TaxID=1869338 RepID=UPI002F91D50D
MPVSTPLPAPPLPGAHETWALFLDVDGSLLEFADRPERVHVSRTLAKLLAELHPALGGALALVSGRPIADLQRLFGNPRWAMAGVHGLQLRHADGARREIELDPAARQKLRQASDVLVQRLPQVLLEDKGVAIALHDRSTDPAMRALREAAEALVRELPDYELQPGHRVIEIKPAGMDKGKAVTELLSRAPFHGRMPVYVGDDFTDEHGFAAANLENGISIRVGSREPSLAQYGLPGPASVQAWLARVLHVLGVTTHAQQSGERRQHGSI